MLLECKPKEDVFSYLVLKYISLTCQKRHSWESEEKYIILEATNLSMG